MHSARHAERCRTGNNDLRLDRRKYLHSLQGETPQLLLLLAACMSTQVRKQHRGCVASLHPLGAFHRGRRCRASKPGIIIQSVLIIVVCLERANTCACAQCRATEELGGMGASSPLQEVY